MKRAKALFCHFLILTAASLALQVISLFFRAYLAQKLGAEGLGLFQLIMSVCFLAMNFATSGIRFTTTRLVAEELGVGREAGAEKVVQSCILYAEVFGIAAMTLLNLGAERIGTIWLHDVRAVPALRVFAFSLPLVSLSSVLSGYLIAVRRAPDAVMAQILDELIEVGTSILLLRLWLPLGLESACKAVILGSCIGEAGSCALQFVLYRADRRRRSCKDSRTVPAVSGRLFRIAIPLACSSYLSAGFRTVEQILIPHGLKESGSTGSTALSTFGVIQGMVMPLLTFPAILLGTVLELIIPELAECRAGGRVRRLNYIIDRVVRIGILFSMCAMWIFLRFSGELGMFLFQSAEAAYFIRKLALLTPFLYLDLLVDMILKDIGEQLCTVKHNLLTSSFNVVLLYLLLPKFAVSGYLVAVYFTRILNFILSLNHLIRITNLSVSVFNIFKSMLCIIGATGLTDLLTDALPVSAAHVVFQALLIVFFYLIFLRALSCISREDVEWGRSLLK